MLITAAFHTGLWTLLLFIVGMINPKWILFFIKKPDRFLILVISTVLFMISATLYGEGNRQAKLENTPKPTVSQLPAASSAPVPVPLPVPETPTIKPGGQFKYNSGCNLNSEIGYMKGFYTLKDILTGKQFDVQIPKFDLIVPAKLN